MNCKAIILSSIIMTSAISPVRAEALSYDHNGSAMRVEWSDKNLTIHYETPRAGLKKHGVKSGTLLFKGKLGLNYGEPYTNGDARIFRKGCNPITYFVMGMIEKGKDFSLSGSAPVLAKDECRVINVTHSGSNARLVFTANSVPKAKPEPEPQETHFWTMGWAHLCVSGVQSRLNLRTGPASSYGRIGELPAGACDVVALNQCIGDYCAVKRNSEIGWANSAYLKKQ